MSLEYRLSNAHRRLRGGVFILGSSTWWFKVNGAHCESIVCRWEKCSKFKIYFSFVASYTKKGTCCAMGSSCHEKKATVAWSLTKVSCEDRRLCALCALYQVRGQGEARGNALSVGKRSTRTTKTFDFWRDERHVCPLALHLRHGFNFRKAKSEEDKTLCQFATKCHGKNHIEICRSDCTFEYTSNFGQTHFM